MFNFFFTDSLYLFESQSYRKREGETDRKRFFHPLVNSPKGCNAMVVAGPDQSQEPNTPSASPTWVAEV